MNNTMLKVTIPLILVLLAGCTSYVHKKPDEVTINNEKIINQSTDKVWANLFNQLYTDSFTVNSVDKNTGIINVTFKTDRPVNYIDCGIVKTNYRSSDKTNHEYTYNYADSTEYLHDHNGQAYNAEVKSDMEATITATVSPKNEYSIATIDVAYKLIRKTTSTNEIDKTSLPVKEEVFEFSTMKPYKSEDISCISTGVIEQNLLDAL